MLGTGVQSLVCFFQRPDVKVSMLGTFVEVLQESLSAKKKNFKLKGTQTLKTSTLAQLIEKFTVL